YLLYQKDGSKSRKAQQLLDFVYSLEWALHSMVMPIFLLLCIRKEHVDSKVYKYEGIRIRVIF
ncbi:hypothetical protein, partial [Dorea longicatena]|uniref:hypothetical protein n=1 Tax=Dorea longicatena TaxID=88431 RepID=UPI003563CF17